MSKLSTFIFTAILCGFCFAVNAQTADDVIDKYVTAMGGKDKLNAIKTLYMEGVAVMQNGNEITTKLYKAQDKLYRREIAAPFGNIVMIVTDKQGWSSNPRNGGSFEAMPEEGVKNQQHELDCAGPLVDYAAKGHKVELVGKEEMEGTEAIKVKLTLKTGQDINYYFDLKTGYILRMTRKGGGGGFGGGGGGQRGGGQRGDGEMKIDYSNYQKTDDGYIFPMTVSMGMGGSNMTFEKIEVNKAIDGKLYKPE
jgi:outer membrane lipoprotein-sorting protein